MKKLQFEEALERILKEDPRYDARAYLFVRESLDYTIAKLDKPVEGPARHVTGQELSMGLRDHALNEFGAIARTVLARWGLKRTEDIGNVVFNLVQKGILGKTDQDTLDDFANGFDFDTAFRQPFLPRRKRAELRHKTNQEN